MNDEQKKDESMLANANSKLTAFVLAVGTFFISTVSNAAINYSTAKTEILGEIDEAESFGVEIGLAILGFIAIISILRHVRGAVK